MPRRSIAFERVHFMTKKKFYLMDIIALTLFVGIFYYSSLSPHEITVPDEARYSEVAREMLVSGDFITPKLDGVVFYHKPILFYWLQAGIFAVAGVTASSIRFLPMIFGVLGCLMTYGAGLLLYDRRTGLISATCLATSVLYFATSHYANMDIGVAVLLSGSLFSFIVAVNSKKISSTTWQRTGLLWLAYFFAGLSVLMKGLVGIAFPLLIVGIWIVLTKNWRLLKNSALISGTFIVVLVTVPWFWLVQQKNPDFLHYFFYVQHIQRFLSSHFNNVEPFWFYAMVILLGLLPWTIFLSEMLRKNILAIWQQPKESQILLYLWIWIVFISLFFSLPASKLIGYIVPIFPPLALLIGHHLNSLWEKRNDKVAKLNLIACAMLYLLISGVLLIVPHTSIPLFHFDMGHYIAAIHLLYCLAAITGIGALLMLIGLGVGFSRYSFRAHYILLVLITTLALGTAFRGLAYINLESSKPLINKMLPYLQKDDEIVAYHQFPQDLSIRTGRRITVDYTWTDPAINTTDNWKNMFAYGLKQQPEAKEWIITDPIFWERWHGSHRLWVFLKMSEYDAFQMAAGSRFILVKIYDKKALVTNFPIEVKK